jgi:hypothetical protein
MVRVVNGTKNVKFSSCKFCKMGTNKSARIYGFTLRFFLCSYMLYGKMYIVQCTFAVYFDTLDNGVQRF